MTSERNPAVVVIGGGLAGLAAAAALADRGTSVMLLESRSRLGGRASSFRDKESGTRIDNCQHVSMGCCTNFRHFCETVGVADLLRTERELYFVGPEGTINRFAAGRLPAPLHLFSAFRRLSYLSKQDGQALSRGLRALARVEAAEANGQTFAEWLRAHNQTPEIMERFWHVVLVSALSESLDRIDVHHARKVFVDAFLANRGGWEVQIPTTSLDEFYGAKLMQWLAARHVRVRLRAGVQRMKMDGSRVAAVELRDGEHVDAKHFILAVPHYLALALLPEQLQQHPSLAGIAKLESAPISSVHLWFDREITPLPHAVFVERLSQWMFNRTALQGSGVTGQESEVRGQTSEARQGEGGNSPSHSQLSTLNPQPSTHYYQVVISASRNLRPMSQRKAIEAVVRELSQVWPEAKRARLVHARMVTEHRAVFSPLPGVDALRPPQQSPIWNLQLAGDWTRTGWPATMEGAVRSGYLAAENVLGHLGRPEKIVQPDLPVSRLSRFLLGL